MLEVLAPAASTRLATLDTLKAELGIADSAQDAALGRLLDQASTRAVRYVGAPFGREMVRETWRGVRAAGVVLARVPAIDQAPPTTINSVVVDDAALDAGAAVLDGPRLIRLRGGCLVPWCARTLVVTYVAGYLLPGDIGRDLPADVERACLVIATDLHAALGRDPTLRSDSVDGIGSSSWLDPQAGAGALPPQAAEALLPYRRTVAF